MRTWEMGISLLFLSHFSFPFAVSIAIPATPPSLLFYPLFSLERMVLLFLERERSNKGQRKGQTKQKSEDFGSFPRAGPGQTGRRPSAPVSRDLVSCADLGRVKFLGHLRKWSFISWWIFCSAVNLLFLWLLTEIANYETHFDFQLHNDFRLSTDYAYVALFPWWDCNVLEAEHGFISFVTPVLQAIIDRRSVK